jgi:hypothetical protein
MMPETCWELINQEINTRLLWNLVGSIIYLIKEMFVRFFKRLVNVAICNMFIIYSNSKSKHVTHKSFWTWQTINQPSTRKTFWEALHWKDPLYVGGGGMGQEKEKYCKEGVVFAHYQRRGGVFYQQTYSPQLNP